jgi:hypothetical protein
MICSRKFRTHDAGSKDPAFLCQQRARAATISICACLIAWCLKITPVYADAATTHQSDLSRPCSEAMEASGLSEALELRDQLWIKKADAWFTAYALKGEALNPLLPQGGNVANQPTPHGFVFASDLNCVLLNERNQQLQIGLRATTYRFHENAGGWSKAMSDGIIMVIDVVKEPNTSTWQARLISDDIAVLPPDATFRMPATNELPPHDKWPTRECSLPKLWNGARCVKPKFVLPDDPR